MAGHSTDSVNYYMSVDVIHKEYLGTVRHWSNLKIGFEEGIAWVKGLDLIQVDSVEVKSIPDKNLYYEKDGRLFLKGSLLPARKVPGVLWSPIERGLEVDLPSFNHNYFGIEQQVGIRIRPSEKEEECTALYLPLLKLESFLQTAPSVRLKNLSWCIAGDHAFIMGKPLLPLQGEALWQKEDFLFPAGFDLEHPALFSVINDMINGEGDCWILWDVQSRYMKIDKKFLCPLTISSFRLSVSK